MRKIFLSLVLTERLIVEEKKELPSHFFKENNQFSAVILGTSTNIGLAECNLQERRLLLTVRGDGVVG